MSVIGERQVTGGNGRNPQTEKYRYGDCEKVFGSVISFGSGQLIIHFHHQIKNASRPTTPCSKWGGWPIISSI